MPVFATPFSTESARYAIPNGQILIHIDIERMAQSQTFKDLYGMLAGNPQAKTQIEDFKNRFGVDPLVDLKAMTVALNAPSKNAPPETSIYVEGNFKPEQIKAEFKKEGAVYDTQTVNGHELLVAQNDSSAVSFLPKGILAANSQRSPSGDVKGSNILTTVLNGKGLEGTLKEASALFGDGKDVWASFRPSAEMLADMKTQNPMIASFTKWDLSLDLAQGLHLHVEGTGSPEGTKLISDLANAQIAKAKSSPQAAMLGGLINKASITANGPTLVVDLPLSDQDVKQLQMMAMMLMMSMQQGHGAPGAPGAPGPQVTPKRSPFPNLQAPAAPAAPVAPVAPAAPAVMPTPAP